MVGLLVVGLLVVGCGGSVEAPPTPPPPHVLLLTVDTLRSDYLASHGYDLPTTPSIDRLLEGGVVFPHALSPVPRTTPALASMLTGAYPHGTEVRSLTDPLGPGLATLAEVLGAAGYRTAAVVSNHVLVRERGLDRGFEIYDAASDSRTAPATTAAALAAAVGLAGGGGGATSDPIFLWVHYIDPHVPYFPPPDLARAFDPGYEGPYAENFGSIVGGIGNQAYPSDLPKIRAVFQNPLSDEVNAHVRRLYAADVRATDDAIGALLAGLRTKLGNRWLVVFTADHGEALGERSDFYYDHGDYVDQASLEVPLGFVLPPGDPRARRAQLDTRVSLVDLAPTLAELLGLRLPTEQVEGRSLAQWVVNQEEPGAPQPAPVFAESGTSFFPRQIARRRDFSVAGRFRTVIVGDWKLVWTPGHTQPWELFDLARDPLEKENLYYEGHPRAEELQRHLRRWFRDRPGTQQPPSPADVERLRSLGYLP